MSFVVLALLFMAFSGFSMLSNFWVVLFILMKLVCWCLFELVSKFPVVVMIFGNYGFWLWSLWGCFEEAVGVEIDCRRMKVRRISVLSCTKLGCLSFGEVRLWLVVLALVLIWLREGGLCGSRACCSWGLVVSWFLRVNISINSHFRLAVRFILVAFKILYLNAAPQFLRVHSMLSESWVMTLFCEQSVSLTMLSQPTREGPFLPLLFLSVKCHRFPEISPTVYHSSFGSVLGEEMTTKCGNQPLVLSNQGIQGEATNLVVLISFCIIATKAQCNVLVAFSYRL